MANRISIHAGSVQMDAVLNDTAAALQIWEALPINASANTWGDEIYFGIPVDSEAAGETVVDANAPVTTARLAGSEP